MSSHNVICTHSENIVRLGPNNSFVVNKYSYGDFLKCTYTDRGEGYFNFVYDIPKLKTFSVSDAQYMKGFTPDIVSNMELRLATIYDKLVPPEGEGPKKLFFRERELLLKYVPDIVKVTFSAKEHEMEFETKIEGQDLFHIGNIQGLIEHRKFGVTNHEGFMTDDFFRYNEAGKKYLVPKDIQPYALFCKHNNTYYDFELDFEKTFSEPGVIKCSLNTRRPNILGFRPGKGEANAEISILRISKAKKLLPKYYLNKAKDAITKEINRMNNSNQKNFKKKLEQAIDVHEKEIVNMLTVDKTFPYRINVKAKEVEKKILLKPIRTYEQIGDRERQYLSYRIFLKTIYEDQYGGVFQSSDIYLNEIKTTFQLGDEDRLKNYSKGYSFSPVDFDRNVLKYLEKYFEQNAKAPYTSFKSYLQKQHISHANNPKASEEKTIELSRFSLSVCGKILPILDKNGKQVEEVNLDHIRAKYDLEEGANVSSYRTMYSDQYYYEKSKLEDKLVIATPIPYTPTAKTKEHCYFMTPEEFVNKTYGAKLILKGL